MEALTQFALYANATDLLPLGLVDMARSPNWSRPFSQDQISRHEAGQFQVLPHFACCLRALESGMPLM